MIVKSAPDEGLVVSDEYTLGQGSLPGLDRTRKMCSQRSGRAPRLRSRHHQKCSKSRPACHSDSRQTHLDIVPSTP